MATLKQLRRRIRSVQSTQQITKAMEMVAASKLKRAQERAVASRPYASRIYDMLESLTGAARSLSHPLFEARPGARRALVVVASDKGLCGSYNMNIFRTAERRVAEFGRDAVDLVAVGRRANQYFRKRGYSVPWSLPELGDQADPARARLLAGELARLFLEKRVDQVELLFTRFVSTATRRVRMETLLPIGTASGEKARPKDYIFEPSPEALFEALLPRYVENRILQVLSESLASEHSARMISMGAATKNAKEVIDNLTLVLNRLRQAAITRELSEIVGGADALK